MKLIVQQEYVFVITVLDFQFLTVIVVQQITIQYYDDLYS